MDRRYDTHGIPAAEFGAVARSIEAARRRGGEAALGIELAEPDSSYYTGSYVLYRRLTAAS